MSAPRFRTAILGFGRIAAGFARDARMARYFRYATHAQVLADHPRFEWVGVLDPGAEARRLASEEWKVPVVTDSLEALERECRPEVVVLATPPDRRLELLAAFPALRGAIVEKPLGTDLAGSRTFVEACRERGVVAQVNYWRRADETLRTLAGGGLARAIGRPRAIWGVYGNGLANNGGHLVDLARMLAGEIESVQAVPAVPPVPAGPIGGDVDLPFTLHFSDGFAGAVLPVPFDRYREVALTIWGESGRLELLQEGLLQRVHPVREHRALEGEREVASDAPTELPPTAGRALYRLYDNLADALDGAAAPWSSLENALRVAAILDAILESERRGGVAVRVDDALAP